MCLGLRQTQNDSSQTMKSPCFVSKIPLYPILTYPHSILDSGIFKILLVLLAAVERKQFRHRHEHSILTKSPGVLDRGVLGGWG